MIVGCYDLHLYCDGENCHAGECDFYPAQAEFTGDETGAQARARARAAGWKLLKSGLCLCRSCVTRGATARDRDAPARTTADRPREDAKLRAVDLDCPEGHAKAGDVCNEHGVGVDLCYPRITAARRANRTARLKRASAHG